MAAERNWRTEAQAAQTWCPWSLVRLECSTQPTTGADAKRPCSVNRTNGELPKGTQCIASRCAAWIWRAETGDKGRCGRIND